VIGMVKHFRILGIFLVFIGMIALLPNQVSACEERGESFLSVIIKQATYRDYDGDGYEDDVITTFMIYAHNNDDDWKGKIQVSCYLESPSGSVYKFHFNDIIRLLYWIQINDRIRIGRIEQYGLVWYNAAFEAGLYTFSISVQAVGNDAPASDYAETTFDPPGGGDPGLPEVGFM
jgi:hypothetical protein